MSDRTKIIESVKYDENPITVEAEDGGGETILFTATCGEKSLQNRMNCKHRSGAAVDGFSKDVATHAHRLAQELAGKIRTAELKKNLLT